jgi:PAS domain S-box-containing protein
MASSDWPGLSKREENVLALYMVGLIDKEIAAALGISLHTVHTYWRRIKEKCGNKTRVAIVAEISRRAGESTSLGDPVRKLLEDQGRSVLEDVLGAVPLLVWSVHPEGMIGYVNEWFLEYTGLPSSEVLSHQPWDKLLPPGEGEVLFRHARELRCKGQIYEHEAPIRRKDGSHRWHLIRVIPILDDNGSVERRVGTATDVHELHGRAQASYGQRGLLRVIADLSDHGIDYCDPFNGVRYSNAIYRKMIGCKGDCPGWVDSIHPSDREKARLRWLKARESGRVLNSTLRYQRTNGQPLWAQVTVLGLGSDGWILVARFSRPPRAANPTQLTALANVFHEMLVTNSGDIGS